MPRARRANSDGVTRVVQAAHTVPETEGPRSKRALILTAAIEKFGKDGYEHTKWATIADRGRHRADRALPLLRVQGALPAHHHEPRAPPVPRGASATATAEVDRADKALEAAIAAAYDVSPREVLQMRILQSHMDMLATPRPSEKEEVERQKARALVREIEEEWTGLIRRGMAAGDFPKRDAHAMATLVLAIVVSVWRWYRPAGR